MLRTLANLGNEHLLRPFDLKLVRRSRIPSSLDELDPKADTRRIVFFHPPKCGGTSVYHWLAGTLGAAVRVDPIPSVMAAKNLGITGIELREARLAYCVQRDGTLFSSGHYVYTQRVFHGREGEFDLITILRNPLDRMVSNYFYNRFREPRELGAIDIDMPEWLSTYQAKRSATVFARMFVGDMAIAAEMDRSGEWHDMRSVVASAIENLERFTIVGTLEHLKDFETVIARRYGIRNTIGHLKKSPRPGYPKFADQPAEIQDRIRELCEADLAIYERFVPARQAAPASEPLRMAG